MFVDNDSKYSVACVDLTGIVWPKWVGKKPVMAFTRQIRSLRMVGSPSQQLSSGIEVVPGALDFNYNSDMPTLKIAEDTDDNVIGVRARALSSCPACRGRHEKHNFDQGDENTRCRYAGLNSANLRDL